MLEIFIKQSGRRWHPMWEWPAPRRLVFAVAYLVLMLTISGFAFLILKLSQLLHRLTRWASIW